MAITVDLATEAIRTGTGSPTTGSHGGAASGVRGVVIALMHGTSATDHITAVSYGGVALARKQRNTDTATEPGAAELWFLGAGVPQGTQTWSYTSGATTDDIHCAVLTLLAGADLEVVTQGGVNNNVANPSVALVYGGRTCMAFAAMYSGLSTISSVAAGANCTAVGTGELSGNFCSRVIRQTTAGSADFTIAATSATDDVAFAAMAVSELNPNVTVALTGTPGTSGIGAVLVALAIGLSGLAGTAAAGTVSPNLTIALTGVGATAAAGTIGPTSAVPLVGVVGTSGVGTITFQTADVTVALTGVAGTGAAGTLVPIIGQSIVGNTATAAAGDVAYGAALPLVGVQAVASPGSAGAAEPIGGVYWALPIGIVVARVTTFNVRGHDLITSGHSG